MTRVMRVVWPLAINAVSIYGVFGAHWPVGTAIALYWCENVLRGILFAVLLGLWYRALVRESQTSGKVLKDLNLFPLLAIVFNGVHFVFLLIILRSVIPRVAPSERFAWPSFRTGLAFIALLLILELFALLLSRPTAVTEPLDQLSKAYFRRIVVVHLTIVLGMFGIVLFDRATVLFGAFAALKVLVDLTPLRRGDAAVSA